MLHLRDYTHHLQPLLPAAAAHITPQPLTTMSADYYNRVNHSRSASYDGTTGSHDPYTTSNLSLIHRPATILKSLGWHLINIIILAAAFGIAVGAWTAVKLRPVAFNVTDPSISQPFYDDTVGYGWLLAVVLVVSLVLYMLYGLADFLRARSAGAKFSWPHLFNTTPALYRQRNTGYRYNTAGLWVGWLWWIGTLQSMAIAILLTQWVKRYSDQLRPNFLAVCFPGGVPQQYYTQPTTYMALTSDCTPTDGVGGAAFQDTLQTFFSGHASTAWSASFYLALFFYHRHVKPLLSDNSLRNNRGPTPFHTYTSAVESWKFVLICIPIVFATWVSSSRLYDHKHHIRDVLIGSLVGILSAIFVYYVNYENYTPTHDDIRAADSTGIANKQLSSVPMSAGSQPSSYTDYNELLTGQYPITSW